MVRYRMQTESLNKNPTKEIIRIDVPTCQPLANSEEVGMVLDLFRLRAIDVIHGDPFLLSYDGSPQYCRDQF